MFIWLQKPSIILFLYFTSQHVSHQIILVTIIIINLINPVLSCLATRPGEAGSLHVITWAEELLGILGRILMSYTQGKPDITASDSLRESGGVVVLPVVTLHADLEGPLVGADGAGSRCGGDCRDSSQAVKLSPAIFVR